MSIVSQETNNDLVRLSDVLVEECHVMMGRVLQLNRVVREMEALEESGAHIQGRIMRGLAEVGMNIRDVTQIYDQLMGQMCESHSDSEHRDEKVSESTHSHHDGNVPSNSYRSTTDMQPGRRLHSTQHRLHQCTANDNTNVIPSTCRKRQRENNNTKSTPYSKRRRLRDFQANTNPNPPNVTLSKLVERFIQETLQQSCPCKGRHVDLPSARKEVLLVDEMHVNGGCDMTDVNGQENSGSHGLSERKKKRKRMSVRDYSDQIRGILKDNGEFLIADSAGLLTTWMQYKRENVNVQKDLVTTVMSAMYKATFGSDLDSDSDSDESSSEDE